MPKRIHNIDPDPDRITLTEANIRLKLQNKTVAKNSTTVTPREPTPEQTLVNSAPGSATKKATRLRRKTSDRPKPAENAKTFPAAYPTTDQILLKDALSLTHSKSARAILQAAGDRAIRREGEAVASVGLMLILQATVAVGLGMPPRTLSTTRWLVDFALAQGVNPEQIASYGSTARLSSPRGEIVFRQAAPAAIRMAVALAEATVGRSRFDARHLIIAALDSPDRAVAEQMRKDSAAAGLDLPALRKELIRRTIETPELGERVEVWQQLLDAPSTAWAQISPIASAPVIPTSTVSGFASDRAAASERDPLGINANVTAFARLICLEEARPPLSIGIFGEWGSGKSSFMERLQLEIATLTKETRGKAETSNSAGPANESKLTAATEPNFIQNVVQIRFNAWHYADANLWASLTAEFFDQLRRGGYEGQRSSIYLALIDKVALHVRSLEASAQNAEDTLAHAERTMRQADEALASARKKLATNDLALASAHIGKALETFQNENANSLKEVGTRIYRTDLSTDIDALKTAVAEASTLPGKASLIARALADGGIATWLGALSVTLFAVFGLMWHYGDATSLAILIQRIIGWGGGTFAALGALWKATETVRPVLNGAWQYAKAVEAGRKELAEAVEKREAEAGSAAKVFKAAKAEAEKAKRPLDQYGDGAAAGTPSTVLRYFLFEDSDVRDYDKQIGLVSRARRSFEQLDAIFTAKRDGPAAQEKQARLKPGETLDPREKQALERYEAMRLDKSGIAIPDRIILYIDDLDRCTHQQVYDVLQAIHLLLAFELFVVVVGVDVRWVEEAVARQFVISAELPASGRQQEAGPTDLAMERRKRAIEYLEKIFQLPFWLRRLSTEGDKGGSYGKYVQELLQANLKTVQPSQSREASGDDNGPSGTGKETPGDDGPALGSTPAVVQDADNPSSVDMALATVQLTQAEVDFLASPEIGAIAFKSPRSVKRMLNVYRIVRARLSEAELDEFLGRGGKPPTWPLAVFFAAIETSQPVEIADALYRAVRTIPPYERFDTVDAGAILSSKEKTLDTANGYEAIMLADEATDHAISLATKAIERMTGEDDEADRRPVISDMIAMARIVRRYSFNRYH